MKRIHLLIALALAVVPVVAGCAATSASGSGSQPAVESTSGQRSGDSATVTFYVPTVT